MSEKLNYEKTDYEKPDYKKSDCEKMNSDLPNSGIPDHNENLPADDPMDFTRGNILKKMIGFMMPILGALVLQTMYGMVDVLVVGRFGTDVSISAVSTGSSIINMVVFVLAGLTTGITVLMGQYIGEKNTKKLSQVVGGAIVTYLIIAAVMTAALLLLAPAFSQLMQAPEAALEKTIVYTRICGGGIVFIIGYNLVSCIYRGIGDSRHPLMFVAIACVVNIFGDLLFVAVFHWDAAGAALATVMAQGVSLVLSVVMSKRIDLPFHLTRSDLSLNKEVKRFLLLGLPIAFQELLTQFSFMAVVAFVNGMGTTPDIQLASSSGYGVASKLVSVVMLIPSALMQSMSSFVAQNVGAGKEKRALSAMLNGMLIGGVIGIAVLILVLFKGQWLASFFTANVNYQIKAAEYLTGYGPEAVVTAVLFSFIGYYNGHNQTLWVMIQGLSQSFLVRLPMAYLMSRINPDTLVTMGICAPAATVFGIILNVVFFLNYRKKLKFRE